MFENFIFKKILIKFKLKHISFLTSSNAPFQKLSSPKSYNPITTTTEIISQHSKHKIKISLKYQI